LTTEAPVTIAWGAREGAIPALCSTFVEFVGSDGVSRLAGELVAGERYSILITTPGGLYRYDLGDQLRCTGHEGPTPRLAFEGRNTLRSDLVGEKLTEAFAAGALSRLPLTAALAAVAEGRPHYELWIDAQAPLANEEVARVERALRDNPQYAYARDLGQLGPLSQIASPGFAAGLVKMGLRQGRRLGDIKATSLLTPEQRDMLKSWAA
jgi:hypothetical protein